MHRHDDRKNMKLNKELFRRWKGMTYGFGYGPKQMQKFFSVLLDFAEVHPEFFRK